MKLRSVVLSLIFALLLSVAVGCDDDEELSLEDYFERLEAISEAGGADVEGADTVAPESIPWMEPDEQAATLQNMFASVDELARQRIAALEGINPPAPVRQAHEDTIAIHSDGLRLWSLMNERAQQTSSLDELLEIADEVDSPAFQDVVDREDEVCWRLQGIADDNDIDVDLGCSE